MRLPHDILPIREFPCKITSVHNLTIRILATYPVSLLFNVLITAGGTIAPIDDVRVLTNRSTGRFATALAESCLRRGADVTYIATTPQIAGPLEDQKRRFDSVIDPAEIRRSVIAQMVRGLNHQGQLRRIDLSFGTVADYAAVLQHECESRAWDLVLLAAAVSDYEPLPVTGKIASDADELVLTLKRTPKVIQQVRGWIGPRAKLAGFKLTSGADDATMLEIAANACRINRADWTIANDQASLNQGRHRVAVVRGDGDSQWFEPGEMMADQVISYLFQQIAS